MLVSTLVVTVVGAAFAFKAARLNESFYCGDTPFSCDILMVDLTPSTINNIPNMYCSTDISTWCPIRVVVNR